MRKLKQNRGATFVLAMVVFLALTIICAALVTGAESAARSASGTRDADRARLAVTSAARLLRQTVEKTKRDGWQGYAEDGTTESGMISSPTPTVTPPSWTVAYIQAADTASGEYYAATDTPFIRAFMECVKGSNVTRTIHVDGMDDVTLELEGNTESYAVNATLRSGQYAMTLYFEPDKKGPNRYTVEVSTTTGEGEDATTTTITYTYYLTTVTWQAALVSPTPTPGGGGGGV